MASPQIPRNHEELPPGTLLLLDGKHYGPKRSRNSRSDTQEASSEHDVSEFRLDPKPTNDPNDPLVSYCDSTYKVRKFLASLKGWFINLELDYDKKMDKLHPDPRSHGNYTHEVSLSLSAGVLVFGLTIARVCPRERDVGITTDVRRVCMGFTPLLDHVSLDLGLGLSAILHWHW